ncbi:hypothetical protein AURDEDRAFT_175953 [Auricularia subglabra TFB-10046 SS5]|nr:hypothetical protein AURDEDRAFT_175953 [Auricularia subglabra TFB-10046 SS5]
MEYPHTLAPEARASEKASTNEDVKGSKIDSETEYESEEVDSDKVENREVGLDMLMVDNLTARQQEGQVATQSITSVLYLATRVTISKDQAKVLAALGAKPATKPEQVTHLIADEVLWTQKFLTSINYAPFIVNSKWVEESVKKKRLLPEAKYLLDHPASAEKYGVNLREAVLLAKKSRAMLLRGCTFYVIDRY